MRKNRLLPYLLLLLLLAACGGREEPPSTAQAEAPTRGAFPRHIGAGPVSSSWDSPHFDMQLLGAETDSAQRLTVHIALYNNYDDQELTFDAQTLMAGTVLASAEAEARPEHILVEQGNLERLLPRSGLIGHLRFAPPSGEQFLLRVPKFPEQSIPLNEGVPGALPQTAVLREGVWRTEEPIVASHEFGDVGMQVSEVRVEGEELVVRLGFINLREQALASAESSLSGADARLIDGRSLAYRPTEVESSLADDILPAGEWAPGEVHSGEIRFPRPASGPLRLEVPTFPPLVIAPAERPLVALATEAHYPPQDNSPLTLRPPPELPASVGAGTISFEARRALLEAVSEAMVAQEQTSFLAHFGGNARAQMEAWWPGIASTPLAELSFMLQRTDNTSSEGLTRYLFFYKLRGDSPQNRFMLSVTLGFGREGERWKVTHWESEVPLWAQVWQVTESPHFLILTDPAVAEQAALLTAEAEVSYQRVAERLDTLSLRDRYVMLVPASQERFTELTEQGHDTQGIASHNTLIQEGVVETNSLRFVLNAASLATFPFEYRQHTIAHELVHLLLATSTRTYTPPWVAEGTATFFGEEIPWDTLTPWLAQRGTERTTLVDLTRPEHFATWDDGQSVPIQYAYSAALVAYLVETYGRDSFLAFYEDYASTENERAYSAALRSDNPEERTEQLRLTITEALLQEHFGQSLDSLEAAAEGWMLRNAAEQLPN